MNKILLIVLFLLTILPVSAQKDPEAKKILDWLSERSQADYPIRVSFEYIYEDLMEKKTTTYTGSLILEEKKYLLNLEESVVYCDGETVWHHLKTANEVYISDADEGSVDDEFFISNPSDLFTFYREGFKYRKTGELQYQGKTFIEIDIFPEDLDKNYHTVKLLVNKKDNRLFSAEAFGKAGANHTVILQDYQAKYKAVESTFVFDAASHPGIEIVDTRF